MQFLIYHFQKSFHQLKVRHSILDFIFIFYFIKLKQQAIKNESYF